MSEEIEQVQPEAEAAQQPPKKRGRAIAVRVLDARGQSALVEYDAGGEARRCYVPAEEVADGKAPLATLEEGIPYGAPWESLTDLPKDEARRFAASLRRQGVWTADDLERKPGAVTTALAETFGITAAALRRAARQEEKEA